MDKLVLCLTRICAEASAILIEHITYLSLFLHIVQVILVGHDFGGSCISFAMDLFPHKISKAVFLAAAMLKNGQSTLDMFSQQVALFILSFVPI